MGYRNNEYEKKKAFKKHKKKTKGKRKNGKNVLL